MIPWGASMKLETDCDAAIFVSSSGHCTLSCGYCIINPIAKRQPSIDFEDLRFLLTELGARKTFLAFSGVGDFFASHPRQARLLDRILDLPVEIGLDINGVIVQELPDLPGDKLAKIRYVNLTMHYHELCENRLLQTWARNARSVIGACKDTVWPDYIVSPLYADEWEAGIGFYKDEVYATAGRPLLLVPDINRPLSPEQLALLNKLASRHPDAVAGVHREDFAAGFAGRPRVACPAGRSYFRLWNDGRLQGCPNLPDVQELSDNGNAKARQIVRRDQPYLCSTPQFCDCNLIDGLGLMGDGRLKWGLVGRFFQNLGRSRPSGEEGATGSEAS